jgi:uncharacterized protein YegL
VQQDIAAVSLIQVFINDYTEALEAEYVFPIPSDASLASLSVVTEERTIEVQVMAKEEAREMYSDTLARGYQPFLGVLTDYNDTIVLHIGSLQPHSEAQVQLTYVTECKLEKGQGTLLIPHIVLPSSVAPHSEPSQEWSFVCSLNSSSPLQYVALNIKHSREQVSPQCIVLKAGDSGLLATDIDLSYSVQDVSVPFILLQRDVQSQALGVHFSLQLPYSPVRLEDYDPTGEFVLLLDRSASMSGERIELAKNAVELFIRSLPEKSLFNVVSFGSSISKIFPESQPYTQANILSAISAVKAFTADMGDTGISAALADCLRTPQNGRYLRLVFLVTDGAVSNSNQIAELVRVERLNTRVSAVGIGAGASKDLIQQVAKAGRGSSTLILDNSQIAVGILRALEQTLQPCVTDITVEWLGQTPVYVHPSKPSYALYGDQIAFNAVLSSGQTAFRLSYIDLDSQVKSMEFPFDLTRVTEGRSALVQAVRGATGTPEEVSLAVEFNVLTAGTSLIALSCQSTFDSSQLYKVTIFETQINGRFVKIIKFARTMKTKYGPPHACITAVDVETGEAFETVLRGSQLNALRPRPKADLEPVPDLVVLTAASDGHDSSPMQLEFLQFQSPNGSWTLTTQLKAALVPHLPCEVSRVLEANPSLAPTVVVTMLVLALLRDKFMRAEGTWRLIAVKGIRWLKKQGVVPATYAELSMAN